MNNNSMVPPSSLSIPQVSIASTPRPGRRGPAGTSPPQNTSMVNTGTPQNSQVGLDSKMTPPTAQGMLPQKSALPAPQVPPQKSEVKMGSMVVRPTVQEMIKAAMAGASSRLDVSREASRQAENLGEKTASAQEAPVSKVAEYDQAMHLADAVEYIADAFAKEATIGEGPNTLEVSQAPGGTQPNQPRGKVTADSGMESPTKLKTTIDHPAGGSGHQELSISGGKGKVASIKDRATAVGKALSGAAKYVGDKASDAGSSVKEKATAAGTRGKQLLTGSEAKAMKKDHDAFKSRGAPDSYLAELAAKHKSEKNKVLGARVGAGAAALGVGGGTTAAVMHHKKKKEASAPFDLADVMAAHIEKAAEDAINPAKISAGAAVPPDTSAAGESGGAPVGGQPEGNTSLVSSIDSAINYTKGQAKAKSKEEMKAYTNEPALKDDGALAAAFSHAGEAGTKMSSVQGSVKTAAARALLSKLAEAASQN